jgi:hypothetical protein
MFKKKTTQSVFATFTKDLQDVKDRETLEAEKYEELEAIAKAKKLEAITESAVAAKAIDNITAMLTGA